MEYASWLAGERWSDHPECTHPLLAGLARLVNDHISDDARARLVPLIPSVIDLTGDDLRADVGIAVRSAAMALPVVAEHRQRALAVSLLTSRKVLTDLANGDRREDDRELFQQIAAALSQVPHAARWGERFTSIGDTTLRDFRRRAAPAAVRISVVGIAEAAVSDRDGRLYHLLETAIADCARWLSPAAESVAPDRILVEIGD